MTYKSVRSKIIGAGIVGVAALSAYILVIRSRLLRKDVTDAAVRRPLPSDDFMSQSQRVSIPSLRSSDWLRKTLKRLRLKPLSVGVLVALINIVSDVSLAVYFNAWHPGPTSHGLLAEKTAWILDFVAQPVIFGYYCWIEGASKNLFASLIQEGIIEYHEPVKGVLRKNHDRLQNTWLSVITVVLSLGVGVVFGLTFTVFLDPAYTGWMAVNPALAWVRAFALSVTWYALTRGMIEVTMIILALNEIFRKQKIQVKPYHPDRAGGLGAIGRFTANLGYLLGLFGVLFSFNLLNVNTPQGQPSVELWFLQKMIAAAFYLILAPVFFYLPIHSAHRAMVTYRDNLLREISEEFNAVYMQIRAAYAGNADGVDSLQKRIQQLKEAHELTSHFRVWPFDHHSLRKFLSLVVAPIVPGLYRVGFDYIASIIP